MLRLLAAAVLAILSVCPSEAIDAQSMPRVTSPTPSVPAGSTGAPTPPNMQRGVGTVDGGPAEPEAKRVLSPANDDRWTSRDWPPLVSGFAGVFAVFAAIFATWMTRRSNEANLAQKANEAEVAEITAKLDGFYGPYLRLSQTNRLLHEDLRARQGDPSEFRVLLLILNADWRQTLNRTDQTIIDEIMRIDGELELMIRRNAGIVAAEVQPYLARASAHFRMIRLAHKGKLENDPARFAKYTYPRTLIAALDLEVSRLEARRTALRAQPGRFQGSIPALVIPEHLKLEQWV